MLNKKSLLVLAVIINIIITVFSSVNVWADAPAGDEMETIANSLPDALILWDLSGSMAQNPAGTSYPYGTDTSCAGNTTLCNNPTDTTYVYSHDSTCTPDSVNCVGSPDLTRIYGADANCTANINAGYCVSTSGTYKYAADASCAANTSKCTGTGCTGGFCSNTSHNNCKTDCSAYNCSGGFCASKKTNCQTVCWCQNGMCQSSKNNCTNQCATNKCDAVNGFCNDQSQADCQTNCSKLAIAKRALFSILDDDKSGTIDALDAVSMGIRIGFMRFKDINDGNSGNDTAGNYSSGAIQVVDVISAIGSNNQTSYQLTYCGNSTSCASTVTSCTSGECIAGESATGGTPLASALKEAKTYLDAHKAGDAYAACRQKFVIILTDGADTFACSGNGQECQSKMYARRREVVATTKQLADAGYKVFVIGFGSQMPSYLQNTLNWMAYYGGTDNPNIANTGSRTPTYNIPAGCTASPAVPANCCNLSSNPTACYPSGVTSCQTDTSTITNSDCGSSTSDFQATYNDPGYLALSGYAFLAGDSAALTTALKSAIDTIKAATYSFTHASIQAQRTTDEDYLYEASFEPLKTDSFWIGHLKRFKICDSNRIGNDVNCQNTSQYGAIFSISDWDAGTVLQAVADNGVNSPRIIYTTNGTSSTLQPFTTSLSDALLGAADDATRNYIVKFIRMGDYAYTTGNAFKNWKLGDILHAAPLSIPTPNFNFYDTWDYTSYNQCYNAATGTCSSCSGQKSFTNYLCTHIRKTSLQNRIILVGANDGQLHAFKTYDGSEVWSFIPPNLLSTLSLMTHNTHPTGLYHTYFVDGPLSAADVWVPSAGYTSATSIIGSTSKSVNDWHTYLVLSEGRGGISTLWSSSTGCDSGFSSSYSSTYNNYCGYYALDITETTSTTPATPTFKWRLGGTSGLSTNTTTNPYDQPAFLGQAWSKMFFGRVRINNNETWVGMIGGGYSGTNCAGTTTCSDKRGKGFYVVDLSNGHILWSFTHDGSGNAGNVNMDYNLVAGPVGIDSDHDGFIDTAYIGDLGGNMWRFNFCLQSDGVNCNVSNWKGFLLLNNH
ncbi:MAG: PilC/PilY family type IV pilus protein [Smithella sp.]|jgi:hypothetical protein